MQEILIIVNIIILEALLSIDNASALATMVKHLPINQQKKALRYWILGAYIFRWLSIVFIYCLLQISILKLVWGLYLVYLAYDFFKWWEWEEENKQNKYWFWKTVLTVEIMDLTLSIDNVFWVVAMTNKVYLIIIWVFIWILVMRFVAGFFINLMNKYPFLETSAFIIIWLLWLKLIISYITYIFNIELNWHYIDTWMSIITISIFLIPIFIKYVRQNILNSISK